jgi:phosphate starvation-inducible protein PhoH and related proteins
MSRNSKRNSTRVKTQQFEEFLSSNPIQIPTQYNQKKFSVHDMIGIKPMTRNQQRMFDLYSEGYNIASTGYAGTGKTFLALYLALNEILDQDSIYEKIIIVRSVATVRDVGFLPGTLEEKTEVFEMPYKETFDELFKKTNQYKYMKMAGLVEFVTTSFIRGVTFRNAIVIFDECQNATYEELSTVITRLDSSSKLIICGDTKQNDLIRKKTDVSGFPKFINVLNKMPSFRNVQYELDDIVRGDIVKEFLIAEDMVDSM